jgi:hypothetical protein
VKNTPTGTGPNGTWLRRFFVRDDAVYVTFEAHYQAKTTLSKAIYLFLYLLPGIVAFVCINVEPVFRAEMALTGLSARYLQYAWVLAITFGWHMFVPFLVLRYVDKLSLRESIAFVGLNRVDWRGIFLVLPVYFFLFVLISVPYQKFVAPIIENWTQAVPLFRIPSYSIFQDTPENMYSFPPVALLILGIGALALLLARRHLRIFLHELANEFRVLGFVFGHYCSRGVDGGILPPIGASPAADCLRFDPATSRYSTRRHSRAPL